jgi:hypothetical protein
MKEALLEPVKQPAELVVVAKPRPRAPHNPGGLREPMPKSRQEQTYDDLRTSSDCEGGPMRGSLRM